MGDKDRYQRVNRIEKIKEILRESKERGVLISKERLVAGLCCDWGMARRSVVEYVNLIINAGFANESKMDNETIVIWN